jgi:hypothetical protein
MLSFDFRPEKFFHSAYLGKKLTVRGGQPAAQTRIENQRIFDISAVLPQFFVIVLPKWSIFLAKFSCCGSKTDLG